MKVKRLLILLLFIFLYGCAQTTRSPFGFKTTSECDSLHTRDSARIQCYHTAAITAAYLCNEGEARSICTRIWTDFRGAPDSGNDIRRKAELVHNKCYYDIAKILRNPALCASIQKQDNLGVSLLGEEVTRDMCYQETNKLAQIAPEYLHNNNTNSMCYTIFILPLILVFSYIRKR
jgi:hypothetical protein